MRTTRRLKIKTFNLHSFKQHIVRGLRHDYIKPYRRSKNRFEYAISYSGGRNCFDTNYSVGVCCGKSSSYTFIMFTHRKHYAYNYNHKIN